MTLRIAFQMDPIENINIDEDTTFRIAEEAQKRNHKIFYFLPEDLTFLKMIFCAKAMNFRSKESTGNIFL